jgi:hypothetical protein
MDGDSWVTPRGGSRAAPRVALPAGGLAAALLARQQREVRPPSVLPLLLRGRPAPPPPAAPKPRGAPPAVQPQPVPVAPLQAGIGAPPATASPPASPEARRRRQQQQQQTQQLGAGGDAVAESPPRSPGSEDSADAAALYGDASPDLLAGWYDSDDAPLSPPPARSPAKNTGSSVESLPLSLDTLAWCVGARARIPAAQAPFSRNAHFGLS